MFWSKIYTKFLAFRGKWQENELFNQNNALVIIQIFCLENRLPRTGTWKKAKRHRRTLNSEWRTNRTGKSGFKIVFLGVDRDKSGRIGFFWVVGRDVGFRSPNRDCPGEIGTVGKYAKQLKHQHAGVCGVRDSSHSEPRKLCRCQSRVKTAVGRWLRYGRAQTSLGLSTAWIGKPGY